MSEHHHHLNINDLIPLQDRVIVERLDKESTTASGIVIPESAGEKPDQGKVKAVGKGKKKENGEIIPCEVKSGDHVIFSKYAGTTVKFGNKEYQILREDDILAIAPKA